MKKNIIVKHFNNAVRTFSLLAMLFLVTNESFAQSHGNHLMLGVGASYPNGLEANLGYEHETQYHNAWEYFGSYYIKYEKDPEVGHITRVSSSLFLKTSWKHPC